jgi:methionyl-tRNA formyltransferase
VTAPAARVVLLVSKQLGLRCAEAVLRADPGSVAAIVTIDDRADGRSCLDALLELGRSAGVDVRLATGPADSVRVLQELDPDLGIVAGWYWLLPEDVIDAAALGYHGIHYSLLPAYRGSSPLVWALLNGDDTVGLSLFRFTAGMDEGPIWGQRTVDGVGRAYIGEVLDRLEAEALDLLQATYPRLRGGQDQPRPQRPDGATYAAARTPDDGRLDWSRTATELERAVRAQSSPYPGAWTELDGQRLTVWRATALEDRWFASPGQVVARREGSVWVGCGDHAPLRLEEVSLGGGPALPAAEVVRSLRTRLGS